MSVSTKFGRKMAFQQLGMCEGNQLELEMINRISFFKGAECDPVLRDAVTLNRITGYEGVSGYIDARCCVEYLKS